MDRATGISLFRTKVGFLLPPPQGGGPPLPRQKSLGSEWRSQNGMELCSERHFPCLLSALCRNAIFPNQENVVLTSSHRVLSRNLAFFGQKTTSQRPAQPKTHLFLVRLHKPRPFGPGNSHSKGRLASSPSPCSGSCSPWMLDQATG
jgi:hypothetical protein